MHSMPNKTIYVSDQDAPLFEEAKDTAGEALSTVIVRALREFVGRHKERAKGMKEITVKVGPHDTEREKHFNGTEIGKWSGFSDDRIWLNEAKVYRTQKGNLAVYFKVNGKATMITNPQVWRASGDYLRNSSSSELLVATQVSELKEKLPAELITIIEGLTARDENPVEYLDI